MFQGFIGNLIFQDYRLTEIATEMYSNSFEFTEFALPGVYDKEIRDIIDSINNTEITNKVIDQPLQTLSHA